MELSERHEKIWGWSAEEWSELKTEPGLGTGTWEWKRGPKGREEKSSEDRLSGGRRGRGGRGCGLKGRKRAEVREEFLRRRG